MYMETKFNLSTIMRNAHKLFKTQSERGSGVQQKQTFGQCLRAAWRAAKSRIGRIFTISWMWGLPSVCVQESESTTAAIAAEYAAGSNSCRYFGD